jgi:hypothetical protein
MWKEVIFSISLDLETLRSSFNSTRHSCWINLLILILAYIDRTSVLFHFSCRIHKKLLRVFCYPSPFSHFLNQKQLSVCAVVREANPLMNMDDTETNFRECFQEINQEKFDFILKNGLFCINLLGAVVVVIVW